MISFAIVGDLLISCSMNKRCLLVSVIEMQGRRQGETLSHKTWRPAVHHWLGIIWEFEWTRGILQEKSTVQEDETALSCHGADADTARKGSLHFCCWNCDRRMLLQYKFADQTINWHCIFL